MNILYEVLLIFALCIDLWTFLHLLLAAAAHGPGADEHRTEGRDGELRVRRHCQQLIGKDRYPIAAHVAALAAGPRGRTYPVRADLLAQYVVCGDHFH